MSPGGAPLPDDYAPYGKWFERVQAWLDAQGLDTPPTPGLAGTTGVGPPPLPTGAAVGRGWRPLGPFGFAHGQSRWWADETLAQDTFPSGSGRISSLAVDPANSNRVLAGSAGGGVWLTENAGRRWRAVTDNQPSLAIGAVAFGPGGVAWAGTGEGNAFAARGAGLLRSADAGVTWTPVASLPAGTFTGVGFFDLVVVNATSLLAATTTGLFRSTDTGANFAQVLPDQTWDLSYNAATGEVLAATSAGLRRSTNHGATFAAAISLPFSGVAAGALPPVGLKRMAVAHAPSDPRVAFVYAADWVNPSNITLARRTTAGGAFTAVALPPGARGTQATYDWVVAVDPANPRVVFIADVRMHRGTLPAAAGPPVWVLGTATAAGAMHPDHHALVFDPANPAVMWGGNDGGVYRSDDGGVSWTGRNTGLAITEAEYMGPHPQADAVMLLGTQDNGTLRQEGTHWRQVAVGDGGHCGFRTGDPRHAYRGYVREWIDVSTGGGEWASFARAPTVPPDNRGAFYPPIASCDTTLALGGAMLNVSRDGGATWASIGSPGGLAPPPVLAAAPAAHALRITALSIPTTDRIYVGRADGGVFVTDFDVGAGAWRAMTVVALTVPFPGPHVLTGSPISALWADPNDPMHVLATTNGVVGLASAGAVAESTNGGVAWTERTTPMVANRMLFSVLADPDRPGDIYVGGEGGVFRRTVAAPLFALVGPAQAAPPAVPTPGALPNIPVNDLRFHQPSRLLRAATLSRGVWEIPVDAPNTPDVELFLRSHRVDTGFPAPGRLAPPVVVDPFEGDIVTTWWESPDIKLDAPPYATTGSADMDIEIFGDDRSALARGLFFEPLPRSTTVRLFAQVSNRGYRNAADVEVRAFRCDPCIGFPPLPAGFWGAWPANAPAAASPWQPVAASRRITTVEPGRPEVAGFDWAVDAQAPQHHGLLVAAGPAATPWGAQTRVSEFLANHPQIALHNELRVRGGAGRPMTPVGALVAWVFAGAGAGTYDLEIEPGSVPLVLGALLAPALAGATAGPGASRRVFAAAQFPAWAALQARHAGLAATVDTTNLHVPPDRGVWLHSLNLAADARLPVVLLVESPARRGRWAVSCRLRGGDSTGGLTLRS